MNGKVKQEKEYEEITVKLTLSSEWLRKLDMLINTKRIFSSRAEAFRRALEILFEKYERTVRFYKKEIIRSVHLLPILYPHILRKKHSFIYRGIK